MWVGRPVNYKHMGRAWLLTQTRAGVSCVFCPWSNNYIVQLSNIYERGHVETELCQASINLLDKCLFVPPEVNMTCLLGRCENGIFAPINPNHILKVTYGHNWNNKKVHFKFNGPKDTALFNCLWGKFCYFYKGKSVENGNGLWYQLNSFCIFLELGHSFDRHIHWLHDWPF